MAIKAKGQTAQLPYANERNGLNDLNVWDAFLERRGKDKSDRRSEKSKQRNQNRDG